MKTKLYERKFRITWTSFDAVKGSYSGAVIADTIKEGIDRAKNQHYLDKIVITNMEAIYG